MRFFSMVALLLLLVVMLLLGQGYGRNLVTRSDACSSPDNRKSVSTLFPAGSEHYEQPTPNRVLERAVHIILLRFLIPCIVSEVQFARFFKVDFSSVLLRMMVSTSSV
ncbi:uncharacterized protein LOC115771338 isoform X1 [Drosophila novamexicana]|uniref:uncharacterized protein LOC115771338 isoform X1 n=1 Tax=Drosophila novamexicana TaxID=47314 RepID=UPI0011E59F00|nr:uncharacterized protein LOC115771338 isoform X1 [Drosophila novamexicana]